MPVTNQDQLDMNPSQGVGFASSDVGEVGNFPEPIVQRSRYKVTVYVLVGGNGEPTGNAGERLVLRVVKLAPGREPTGATLALHILCLLTAVQLRATHLQRPLDKLW